MSEQTRTCATARRPESQQASAPRNPTLPRLSSQAAGVTFQLPREGRRACLSGVLPPSLLSSFFFPCWFPWCCLEAGGARWPLRPSEGLAEVVEPHLLVAVRFHPTSRGQWLQGLRAPTQEPRIPSGIPSVHTPLVRCYLLLYFWHLEQFLHDPEPQVVEGMVQFIPQVHFSKCFFGSFAYVSSGNATPVTVHPDSSEDREGSTNAVP